MQQRALLVQGIYSSDFTRHYSFDELVQLAATAGVIVVGRFEHRNKMVNPNTYLGKGTVQRLKETCNELLPDVVIIDAALNPRQYRELSTCLECRLVDRTELILNIFSQHASSAAGQLQVKKALLTHMLPRLTGQGQQMSRLGGGIGTRGPGETQLEIDRRRLRAQIREVDQQLVRLKRNRRQRRKLRLQNSVPLIALAGYTNAGKSTLHRVLTGSSVPAEHKLFTTLDPKTSEAVLGGLRVLVTDTVGFISRLPAPLIEAFHSTLEVISEADCVLHVIDASSQYADWQIETGERLLKDLGIADDRVLRVFNKVDLIGKQFCPGSGSIAVSAKTGKGLTSLAAHVQLLLTRRYVRSTLLIPYRFTEIVHELYERGLVLSCQYLQNGIAAEVKLRRHDLERLVASGQVQLL